MRSIITFGFFAWGYLTVAAGFYAILDFTYRLHR